MLKLKQSLLFEIVHLWFFGHNSVPSSRISPKIEGCFPTSRPDLFNPSRANINLRKFEFQTPNILELPPNSYDCQLFDIYVGRVFDYSKLSFVKFPSILPRFSLVSLFTQTSYQKTIFNKVHQCLIKFWDSRHVQLAKCTVFEKEPDALVKNKQFQHLEA